MAKKEKKKIKYTPPRRAKNWQGRVGQGIGRIVILLFATTVIGLMFSGLQAIGISWLVTLLTVLILSGLALLYVNEGMGAGVRDTEVSRRVEKMEKDGRHVMEADDRACYSPICAAVTVGIVFLIPFLISIFVAINTKPYTYSMQDLPTWISQSYGTRSDIMAPLGAYMQSVSMNVVDWCRLVVRLLGMIYVDLFPNPEINGYMIDRTLPLFFLLYPTAYMVGYLMGPRRQAVLARKQKRAKKVAVKKAQKHTLAEELTTGGAEVHYGQRNDREQEKNRLI